MPKAHKAPVKKTLNKKPTRQPVKHTSRLMRDVEAFHKKFGRKPAKRPELLSVEEFDFRLRFINEELDELVKAYAACNLADFTDALVDITYVVLGAAHLANLPFDKAWAAVHKANMKKKKAKAAADSTRGYVFDVVKPKGWQPPNIGAVLSQHGCVVTLPPMPAARPKAPVVIEVIEAERPE